MALTEIKTSGIADDAVTTDKLANAINTERTANTAKTSLEDNAVTLAKMAGGTDGQIITYDANGDPIAVGPGTDGQVLTSTGAGSPPAFEDASAGAALTGSTNNTVVTVTGANAMAGEANLTFDGGTLQQAIDANDEGYTILADGNHRPTIVGDRDAAGEHDELLHLVGKWNNTQVGAIDIQAGADTSNKDDGHIIFYTSSSGGSLNNRMKIHNDGTVAITDGNLKIATAGHGIDFSAQTATSASGASMTEELLDHYEVGTFTPYWWGYHHGNAAWQAWPMDTAGTAIGKYIRIGNVVHVYVRLLAFEMDNTTSSYPSLAGLPFTGIDSTAFGCATYADTFSNDSNKATVVMKLSDSTKLGMICNNKDNPTNNGSSNRSFYGGATYFIA